MEETLGQRITYLMKQNKISNIEMGALLGVNPSYISKFKNDTRRPNTKQINKIATKLGVTIDFLLGNEETGLPFYYDYTNGKSQSINLMNGLSAKKHFALYNKWDTINGISKDEMLIFARPTANTNNAIALVSYDKQHLTLGRLQNGILFFDNGLAPINITENDKYAVEGRLVRAIKYYN